VTTAENKRVARQFFTAWGGATDSAVVDELADPALRVFYPLFGTPTEGPVAFKRALANLHRALPDLVVTVEDEVAEGDRVALRWTMRGTHRGECFGNPPTGKIVAWSGLTIYRFAEGKVTEEIGEEDGLGLFRQLGAIITPAPAPV
jgi:steroid delta-isomerase-like uncharacterized protein